MKKVISLILILMFFCSCSQNNNTLKNTKMKYSKTSPGEQTNYILDLTLKTPYELFIDDIKIASNYSRGSNAAVELNPYILKNGKHKIKLKLFPFWQHNESTISNDEILNSRLIFGYYLKDRTINKVSKYVTDVPLEIKIPTNPISYFEQDWEVDIKNLPYELEGWSKGQDLSKMDQNELKKKVILHYEKLWSILNKGDADSYQDLRKTADAELVIYDYLTEDNYNKVISKNALDFKKCENTMIPLEDYEMKLHADGKMVSLERKTHTREFNDENPLDIKGWSPLIRKYKVSG
ncbi:hypothetical protein [Chryseobacterium sp. NKUCC03_KSP]|uniref:hypothetical protein n=1 Tax=Chryseobacterium sp. NKUCC03_KSP TaxID=2842125 RepID=UPI001C5B83E8|nr:hypothetical protein [Chryseobacterium sp. NKUCC03_KSP]MBW3524073.1 hypothetical protein [Chryseobacterium sp. NKUCC03_KSP]